VLERVDALMREVAAEVVLPRFQRLAEHEIAEKGPGDLVTVADRESERLLTERLPALLPGSAVVGEEAVAADPTVLDRLQSQGAVWLVDPVDGTANFAAGREPFAMMVALLRGGETVAGWILDPVAGTAAIAERGSGAYLGGVRVTTPQEERPATALHGPVSASYLPAEVRTSIAAAAGTVGALLPGRFCAGYEYPAVVRDQQQFIFFWRMNPWDHAAGTLLVEESGGKVAHLDGARYDPTRLRTGTLIALNASIWQTVRSTLLAAVPV
jgi:fructose-1,6-bisphosphatase/inositol monophosphatase family enzyme